jgi:tetratricopeptide (TPR) repeat protein
MRTLLPGLALRFAVASLGMILLFPGLHLSAALFVAAVAVWLWGVLRRIWARVATAALRQGRVSRARRWYWLLRGTSVGGLERAACRLSLAACDAAEAAYERCLQRLSAEEGRMLPEVYEAVALNLRAYSRGRLGIELEKALQDAERALALRPSVPGFLHTRGMLHVSLGHYEAAIRDLDGAWRASPVSPLLEAERCYDLGRLWLARGQQEYATDYFRRSLRSAPESRWAEECAAQDLSDIDTASSIDAVVV